MESQRVRHDWVTELNGSTQKSPQRLCEGVSRNTVSRVQGETKTGEDFRGNMLPLFFQATSGRADADGRPRVLWCAPATHTTAHETPRGALLPHSPLQGRTPARQLSWGPGRTPDHCAHCLPKPGCLSQTDSWPEAPIPKGQRSHTAQILIRCVKWKIHKRHTFVCILAKSSILIQITCFLICFSQHPKLLFWKA